MSTLLIESFNLFQFEPIYHNADSFFTNKCYSLTEPSE